MNAPDPHALLQSSLESAAEALEGARLAFDSIASAAAINAATDDYRAPLEVWPYAANDAHPKAGLDAALWQSAPVVCAPLHAELELLDQGSRPDAAHRFIVAEDGLWIEVRRPWLHLVRPLTAKVEDVTMPYGTLAKKLHVAFDKAEVRACIRSFADEARTQLPNEHALWCTWQAAGDNVPGRLCWREVGIIDATPGSLSISRPVLDPDESLAIDFHSHGTGPAFFSETDNEDDFGEVKIAIVLGNLDRPVPSIVARLCYLGAHLALPLDAAEVFA